VDTRLAGFAFWERGSLKEERCRIVEKEGEFGLNEQLFDCISQWAAPNRRR